MQTSVSLRVCVCKVSGPSAASCSITTGLWSTAGGSDLALKEIVMGMSESYYYTASSSLSVSVPVVLLRHNQRLTCYF